MCVIAVITDDKVRPSDEEVAQMWEANSDGGGIAWRTLGSDGLPTVAWIKGIQTLHEMQLHARRLPVPFILHFRIASSGGKLLRLTHPFPLSNDCDLSFTGNNSKGVLFHNGTWTKWENTMTTLVAHAAGQIKLPTGPWSDTRSMAFLAHHFGLGMLELINEKTVVLGPGEEDLDFFGGPWDYESGFVCSNGWWRNRRVVRPDNYYTTPPKSLPAPAANAGQGTAVIEATIVAAELPKQAGGPGAVLPFVDPREWLEMPLSKAEEQFLIVRALHLRSQGKSVQDRLISKGKFKQASKRIEQCRRTAKLGQIRQAMNQPLAATRH